MKKIERLGDNGGDVVSVYASDLDELEQQRDEAVEIVVDYTRGLEDSGRKYLGRWTRNIAFLENLTGQTWEEIKEPPCKN